MIGKIIGLSRNRGKTRKMIKKGQKYVKKRNNLDLRNSFETVKTHELKDVIVLVERDTTDCQCLALLRIKVDPLKRPSGFL